MTSPDLPLNDATPLTTRPSHIRSFVHRQGRQSKAQRRYLDENWSTWGIPFEPATGLTNALLDQAFGRAAPLWLEIGFGMGDSSSLIAKAHPHVNYLGVEVYPAGVGSMLKQIEIFHLQNIRIIRHDAVSVLQSCKTHGVKLDHVMIFFPDPWPKLRHHKRRLIQPLFAELVTSVLNPGGSLHCATDWGPYAFHMLEVLQATPGLQNLSVYEHGFMPRPTFNPFLEKPPQLQLKPAKTDYRHMTKFERRGLMLGHGVWDLMFQKQE